MILNYKENVAYLLTQLRSAISGYLVSREQRAFQSHISHVNAQQTAVCADMSTVFPPLKSWMPIADLTMSSWGYLIEMSGDGDKRVISMYINAFFQWEFHSKVIYLCRSPDMGSKREKGLLIEWMLHLIIER